MLSNTMNIWTPFHYEYHFNNLQINKQNSNVAITIFSLYRLIVIKNSLKLAKNSPGAFRYA